jgi:MerR family redox-sensitive transcriptional activator SoxR
MSDQELLTIGGLAERTGVARSALRYYEQRGLLPATSREAGQRRYHESAVAAVGVILLLRDVGFSLREIRRIMPPGPDVPGSAPWRDVAASKLRQLDDHIAKAEAARSALRHALARHDHDHDIVDCPRFWQEVNRALQGASLQASHPH